MKMIQTLNDTPACKQTHWELVTGKFVVVSTVDSKYAKETMIFEADEKGDIVSFHDLCATHDITVSHEQMIAEWYMKGRSTDPSLTNPDNWETLAAWQEFMSEYETYTENDNDNDN